MPAYDEVHKSYLKPDALTVDKANPTINILQINFCKIKIKIKLN